MKHPLPRHALLPALASAILLASSAAAQQTPRYAEFTYDSTFHIGGHAFVPYQKALELRFDYLYCYTGDIDYWPLYLASSTWPVPGRSAPEDSLMWDYVRNGGDSLKLIYNLPNWHRLIYSGTGGNIGSARSLLSYPDHSLARAPGYTFAWRSDSGEYPWLDSFKLYKKHLVYGVGQRSDLRMLANPTYVSTQALNRPDTGLYNAAGVPETDTADWVRVSFDLRFPGIEKLTLFPSDTLAWARFYWRVDTMLTDPTCYCPIYEPVRDSIHGSTFVITKQMYDNTPETKFGDIVYQEFGRWINLRGGKVPVPPDSVNHTWVRFNTAMPDTPTNAVRCDSLFQQMRRDHRIDSALSFMTPVTQSDLVFEFFSTRLATIEFIRSRVSNWTYELLLRGDLDSLLRSDVMKLLDTSAAMQIMRDMTLHIGIYDEPVPSSSETNGILSQRMQDLLYQNTSWRPGLFNNPVGWFDDFRYHAGDFDTSLTKRVHTMSRQNLNRAECPVPVHYANPDRMDSVALATFYAVRDTTLNSNWSGTTGIAGRFYPRNIYFNDLDDHRSYTDRIQALFGCFADYTSWVTTGHPYEVIPGLARAVDVAQFKYADLGADRVPVWNVVPVAAYFAAQQKNPNDARDGWIGDSLHPPTPEEITAQCWLTLSCGAQGLEYSDMASGNGYLSMMHFRTGGHDDDYSLCGEDHAKWAPLPRMWIGHDSKFKAVRRIGDCFRDTILPVYEKLEYRQEQMSVHDTARQHFAEFPLIDTLYTQWARQRDTLFVAVDSFDARGRTYVELTHFRPGPRLADELAAGYRYFLVVNRRTWPISHVTFQSVPSGSDTGLGNIDVRRPWVRLKNSTDVIADSFRVEKVGYETTWSRTVAIGDTVALDWLTPGWGGLYRVTPIPSNVSWLGVAFNNAVHAENPSTRDSALPRLVVYERDSVVYLRTSDQANGWGRELMISSVQDTTPAQGGNGKRAWNFRPAIACMRNGSSALVVWERLGNNEAAIPSIEALWIEDRSTIGSSIGDSIRFRVLQCSSRFPNPGLAPAVVATDGGYLVASPLATSDGITVVAVRDNPLGLLGGESVDTARVNGIHWNAYPQWCTPILDSTALFPTLAFAGTNIPDDSTAAWQCTSGLEDTTMCGQAVHLAFQQGTPDVANSQHIMYAQIGVHWNASGVRPTICTTKVEHVSAAVPGCGFLHPSIAADRQRVAIAFQAHSWQHRRVVLRFRQNGAAYGPRSWRTPAYIWEATGNRWLEWPSLTMFPYLPDEAIADTTGPATGLITWWRTNAPGSAGEQYLYRFRSRGPVRIDNGVWPTLTLAARSDTLVLEKTGVLYRGDTTRRVIADERVYYPALQSNSAPGSSSLFSSSSSTGMSFGATLQQVFERNCDAARDRDVRIDLRMPPILIPDFLDPGGPVTNEEDRPGVPAIFFARPVGATLLTDSIIGIAKVTRSSTFTAGAVNHTVTRRLQRASNVLLWLDAAPYDSLLGTSATIRVFTELVRAADEHVLWSGDTLNVRTIPVDSLVEDVEVPVAQYAAPGTSVYIRLRAEASAGLDPEVSTFVEWGDQSGGLLRPVRRNADEPAHSGKSGTGLSVIPNPLRGPGSILIATPSPGVLRMRVTDARGWVVAVLPEQVLDSPGQYEVAIDATALPTGVYTIDVELGGVRASSSFVVVR